MFHRGFWYTTFNNELERMFRMITQKDKDYLEQAIKLAETALEKGDEPFGSILVAQNGEVLYADHNHVSGGDHTQHPEFAIARWAANNLSPSERQHATVYTSGEHCPMCAAAHGWVGLGRIVYASSSAQLGEWAEEMGLEPTTVKNLAIEDVLRNADISGPVPELASKVKKLHLQFHAQK